jgi:hypothetical protein
MKIVLEDDSMAQWRVHCNNHFEDDSIVQWKAFGLLLRFSITRRGSLSHSWSQFLMKTLVSKNLYSLEYKKKDIKRINLHVIIR